MAHNIEIKRMYETWDGQRGMGMVMEPPKKKKGPHDKWYQRHAWKAGIEGEGGELGSLVGG